MIIPRRHPPGRVAVSLVIGGLGVLYALYRGFLWATLAWLGLGRSRARRWWTGAALAAVAALTAAGLLSAFGVIGRFVGWP